MAARSSTLIFSLLGRSYIAIVRGVPDIAYFLFFVIALDQILEWMRHKALCRDWSEPIRQGNDFVVCDAAKLPLSSAAPWVHDLYGFALAVFTFGIVFGAFASNVIYGAYALPLLLLYKIFFAVGILDLPTLGDTPLDFFAACC